MSKIDEIEKRVRATICTTWSRDGLTLEGRISKADFEELLIAARWASEGSDPVQPACGRCENGWLPAIEGRDGSYITSRPCNCERGREVGRL